MNSGTNYGYARLTQEQVQILKKIVSGKHVVDFGCGNLELSKLLLQLGAKHVTGIDKSTSFKDDPKSLGENFTFQEAVFDAAKIPEDADIALISWPQNNDETSFSLKQHLLQFEEIIYIGKNDGEKTQCGTPFLWQHLISREPLYSAVESDSISSMIVYSSELRRSSLLDEEIFGLDDGVSLFSKSVQLH